MKYASLIGAIFASLIAGTAIAGSLGATETETEVTAPPAAPAALDWSGFYLGLAAAQPYGTVIWHTDTYNGGGDSAEADWENTRGTLSLGYNIQRGQMVYGAEIDYTPGTIQADIRTDTAFLSCNGAVVCRTEVSDLLELRAKAGRSFGRSLVYVAGGFAKADAAGSCCSPLILNGSGSIAGYSIGVGFEYAVSAHASFKAEYSQISLDRLELPDDCETCSVTPSFRSLRLGLNLRF